MTETADQKSSRREFLQGSGSKIVPVTALAGAIHARAYAQQNNTIQVALVGCGGRGTGAAVDALSVRNGPIKLVAMADVFQDRLDTSIENLRGLVREPAPGNPDAPALKAEQVDVPKERQFAGFDGYKHAIDCLQPGDVAIFATPPAFRWVHFQYAIEKGVNVFMEKPISVDGPSARKMFQLGELSEAKNLKVGVGLMCRHCVARKALLEHIQDGRIGEIVSLRAYRMHGPVGFFSSPPKPPDVSELLYQVRRFHSFIWASGGAFNDFYIHNIDECCWMKGALPIKAEAGGGRFRVDNSVDQNFDNYCVQYTFADGATLQLWGRCIDGCYDEFASYAHGRSGSAVISTSAHTPARCRIYRGQDVTRAEDEVWSFPQPEPNPYRLEWDDLIDAIRKDRPYNEVKVGTEASLVTTMGRYAAHTGQVVTYEQMLNHPVDLAPGVDRLTMDSPAPLRADAEGRYPVPEPGVKTDREY